MRLLVQIGSNGREAYPGDAFPFASIAEARADSNLKPIMQKVALPTQRVRAPEFPRDFAWVNTDRPLYIKEQLKGSVVVLDFWTYCCINCMHVLPDLEYIEQKYAGQPVVIVGVHSAKFDNEGDRRNIETAASRYHIAHPVIVDERHRIWSEYGVRAWPTLMVIDPEGRIVGALSGEGNREALDAVVSSLLEEGHEKGTLAAAPPMFQRKGRVPSASGLAFPGKVLAEPSGKFVFISDSNHDRVIIADPTGKVMAIAGSGKAGQADGAFAAAEFNNPQGLAYDSAANLLYIADTDNHLIRKLDLTAKTVETISGTGEQVYDRVGGKMGREQGLNSPWDLSLVAGDLFIAMAGSHQLWVLNLKSRIAQVWAGSGMEDIIDGTGSHAALAQSSGIVRKGDWLYFADSEVSAIRRANLQTRAVETLVGRGLFDFGDREGGLNSALLQHPLGVSVYGDDILVADTYNHKIKRINEAKREIRTLAGTGSPDTNPYKPAELALYEPGGLSVRGDTLYIADTNHDRVIEYQLANGHWREFELKGLQMEAVKSMDLANAPLVDVPLARDKDLRLRIFPELPRNVHVNREAPINYTIAANGNSEIAPVEGLIKSHKLPFEVVVSGATLQAGKEYPVTLTFAYCTDENESLCVPVTLAWRLKTSADFGAANRVDLSQKVEALEEMGAKQ